MWIASKLGFYSIVKKDDDEFQGFHVRARTRVDLENLKRELNHVPAFRYAKIIELPTADYRFRFVVKGEQAIKALFQMLMETIDYDNFKSMVAKQPDQRNKIHAYSEVWSSMYGFQAEEHGLGGYSASYSKKEHTTPRKF